MTFTQQSSATALFQEIHKQMTDISTLPNPTPTFWDNVLEGLRKGIRLSGNPDDNDSDMVSLAFGINAAWIDLMLDKYHSLYRFDSIDTFVDAVQGESGISIRSYDHFSCIVATSNIEWMVEKLVSVNGSLPDLLEISISPHLSSFRHPLYKPHYEGVREAPQIMLEIDALVPAMKELIARERIEYLKEMMSCCIRMTTQEALGKPFGKRRKVSVGPCTYLLDDANQTAWISDGTTSGDKVFTLPESVTVEGTDYAVTGVDIGAFPDCGDIGTLIIPDCYTFIDEDCFRDCVNLRKVVIGKGVENYFKWSFTGCPLEEVVIDPGNPYIKVAESGDQVLSADGTRLLYAFLDKEELTVPEGVKVIEECAISCNSKLKILNLPTTLERIEGSGIFKNSNLQKLIIPEGVNYMGTDAVEGCSSLCEMDLPSTLRIIPSGFFSGCGNLRRMVLRSRVPVIREDMWDQEDFGLTDNCIIAVPEQLLDAYRKHPIWSNYSNIVPIL